MIAITQMHNCTKPLPKILKMEILKVQIESIFKNQEHQSQAIIDIYKLMIPDWEAVKKVHGWPEVGASLWKFICEGFIKFDRKHHPDVFAGGIWLNHGFSFNSRLAPWEVSFDNCLVEY